MSVEIEAKFLNIDRDDLRRRLQTAGFSCVQPDYLMRRVAFDVPGRDFNTWARVRDENGKITVSYKRTKDGNRIDGTEEIEIIADDFDTACRLLSAFGLIRKGYQETRREIWLRGETEVTLDEWPAIAPFTEIEAQDEAGVKAVAAELGFDWKDAIFGAVGSIYQRQGISAAAINRFPRLTFENVDEILELKESASG